MDAEPLTLWLSARYDFAEPVAVALLRSYTNDVYRLETGQGRFVLKVYGQGWRTESEIAYETALVQHLRARGMRLAAPIAGRDGRMAQRVENAKGERYAVLSEYMPGEKPQPPFTPDLYETFGAAIGEMHRLSDDFETPFARRPLDLTYLLDETCELVLPLLPDPAARDYLRGLAERIRAGLAALTRGSDTRTQGGLDWGPIHGDATLDNLHRTAEGAVILYDFDSGGPGWRAADLQGWAEGHPEYAERHAAFLRGYARMRPLREADRAAAPYLTLAWDFWGIRIDLERRVLRQGAAETQAYLTGQIARLRASQETLLP